MSDRPEAANRPQDSGDELHLQRLFRLSLDLMCIAGIDGFFKQVNPAFERVLGYGEEELLARQFVEFVHPEDQESTLAEVANLAQGAVTIDFENRYRTRDGEYRWLAWRAAPLVESGLIYAVARDITEQKLAQEQLARKTQQLAQSNADLEQFAHVASHDLRAPLRSIVALARFVEEDLGDSVGEKTRGHLRELRRRALLMKALTDDLLVYSRAGRDPAEVTVVDTPALVRNIVFLLDPPPGFEIVADESLPVFETARGPLEQVLRNLVANAIKHHHREEGRIVVSAHDGGERWEFRVTDDGPGIAQEDRARILRIFDQLELDDAEGWGMGLALIARLVERFGGRVAIEGDDKTGSTFRFDWPKRLTSDPSTQ